MGANFSRFNKTFHVSKSESVWKGTYIFCMTTHFLPMKKWKTQKKQGHLCAFARTHECTGVFMCAPIKVVEDDTAEEKLSLETSFQSPCLFTAMKPDHTDHGTSPCCVYKQYCLRLNKLSSANSIFSPLQRLMFSIS